jgi:hypothetical protein
MDIFEIIDQFHITVTYNDYNDNNNDDDSSPKARKRARDLESYNSIKSTSKFYLDDN